MAKETSSSDSSLPLHEVLEAEFVALHGELPSDYPGSSEPKTRLKALCDAIHGLKEKRAALCISGGGIRSATFGLGILQGLARCGLLEKFHFLSTVSGGGYIGSWLSAWIKNDPDGIRGVVAELKRQPVSTLNPEPRPIRHLRELSSYLAPRAGLTSVDFWTLVTTFIRNMFLNWLVLISWLAAAMMIPRLYLAAINLQPEWPPAAPGMDNAKYAQLTHHIMQQWDWWLNILPAIAFILIAVAMAYAIIDVPSTGNARFSQRRFLKYRQLPLFLASLVLAAWWAVFCNVYGKLGVFQHAWGLLKFVLFFVFSYVCGGVLAMFTPWFGNREHKAQTGGLWRFFVIFVTTLFAGFCLWAMATRMFLDHRTIEFALNKDCEATQIPSGEKMTLPQGTTGEITKIVEGTYTVGILGVDQPVVRIAEKALDPLMTSPTPDPQTGLKRFTFKDNYRALQIPSGRETLIKKGTDAEIMENIETNYTIETNSVSARVAKKDLDEFELQPNPGPEGGWIRFRLKRSCDAKRTSNDQTVTLPGGVTGLIEQIGGETYAVETDRVTATIAKKDLNAVELRRPLPAPANHAVAYVCFAPPLVMAVVMLVNFLFTGLASWVSDDEDREWWARSAAWITITIVAWIVINAIVLWGGQAITAAAGNQIDVFLGQLKANPVAKAILGTFGGVSGIAGALLALRSKLGAKLGRKARLQWPLVLVAIVFFVLLAVVISWVLLVIGAQPWVHQLVAFLGHMMADPKGQVILVSAFVVATAGAGVFLFLRSNLSKGLVSFVLLAGVTWWILLLSGAQRLAQEPNDWRAQLFIVVFLMGVILLFGIVMGFLINANKFSLHATYRNRLIRAYLAASRPQRRPNFFTMSRLHCGSFQVRYRPSREYGHGITLGTALAISGAAANPNMGYHSSPVLSLLMTLFNVRLGWWLGNPGPAGSKTWKRAGPRYSVGPLFSEAAGNTTDRYQYVNLSDGGHFENLGLYEMVLRRCHWIVVSDAGEDAECSFADLGEAVRKIRIDFGIPIEFDRMTIYPRSGIDTLKTPGRCAVGRICYSVVDGADAPDGVIVYIKPACYGDEPRDIYEYSKRNEMFPHESTADQFFSESQFESYRMLGAHTMEKLCTDCHGDFDCFIRDILKNHLQTEAPVWLAGLLDETKNKIA